MNIGQYDKVLLKDGSVAYIVEVFDNGKAFIADIDRNDDTDTDWITVEEIDKILKKHSVI